MWRSTFSRDLLLLFRPVGGGQQRWNITVGRDRVEFHPRFLQHGGHQPVWCHQNHVGLPAAGPSQQRCSPLHKISFFHPPHVLAAPLCSPHSGLCFRRSDGFHLQHLLLFHLPEHGCLQRVQERPGGLRRLSAVGDGQLRSQGLSSWTSSCSCSSSSSWVWGGCSPAC